MEIGSFITSISLIKNFFGWMFKKKKLTILVYREWESTDINFEERYEKVDYNLIARITNNTSSSIILKEIKWGKQKWEYIYERGPLTLYPDDGKNSGVQGETMWQVTRHNCDFSDEKNGSVMVKDINNKIHKSKYIDTQFWI